MAVWWQEHVGIQLFFSFSHSLCSELMVQGGGEWGVGGYDITRECLKSAHGLTLGLSVVPEAGGSVPGTERRELDSKSGHKGGPRLDWACCSLVSTCLDRYKNGLK